MICFTPAHVAAFQCRVAAGASDSHLPEVRALHQSHAAAEDKTVHQGNHRFGVVVQGQVEGVFLFEEHRVQGVVVVSVGPLLYIVVDGFRSGVKTPADI